MTYATSFFIYILSLLLHRYAIFLYNYKLYKSVSPQEFDPFLHAIRECELWFTEWFLAGY